MKTLLAFAALIATTSAIFAGQSFENIPAPYFARINIASTGVPSTVSVAGGSIISNQHIVCAASTIHTGNIVLNVHIGGNTRTTQRVFLVQRSVQHPDYVHVGRLNNIGLIFLSQTLRFDATVRPIPLPAIDSDNYPFENMQGQVLGFGGNATNAQMQASNILEGAFVRVTNETRCVGFFQTNDMNNAFCGEDSIQRSDFCEQDIGGGFTIQMRGVEVLVGIASVPRCFTNVAAPSLPSLYTRVVPYVAWIREETGI
ncbi:hypothetical protein PVAND_003422 [Polypedilum vanderplanki]|uniref:Peptidase S1 domain-containing protein n=1 Tax=Polypedilum vanderplanki TaxID=319348 RepID=A0A9J6BV09_POLVA|nr:hypothetical protein PVAND_003422 [Polypedilum vanderplanki]